MDDNKIRMGKDWNNRSSGGGGGGGGGGGNDVQSIRGYGAIIGTCDAAREKESNKELINLVNQAIERLYPELLADTSSTALASSSTEHLDGTSSSSTSKTNAELLQDELNFVRKQSKTSKHHAMSVNIGIKGIVVAKLTSRSMCPVKIVTSIFTLVADERQPICRHLIRVIPLSRTFFPNVEELRDNTRAALLGSLCSVGTIPTVLGKRKTSDETEGRSDEAKDVMTMKATEEDTIGDLPVTSSVEGASTVAVLPPLKLIGHTTLEYCVQFKRRNHNTLERVESQDAINAVVPSGMIVNYRKPEVRKSQNDFFICMYIYFVYCLRSWF